MEANIKLPMAVMYADGTIERNFRQKKVVGIVAECVNPYSPIERRRCVFDLENSDSFSTVSPKKSLPSLTEMLSLDIEAFNQTVWMLRMFGKEVSPLKRIPYRVRKPGKGEVFLHLQEGKEVKVPEHQALVRYCQYLN